MGPPRTVTDVAAIDREKQELRERIWELLTSRRVARFPFPIHDRIPNFAGAGDAARLVAELPEWKAARRLKCNPDAPQLALRRQALEDGKVVFMAVPRLRAERCFLRLDPAKLRGKLAHAATIGGAGKLGEPVRPDALGHIDLVVAGSVAVDRHGGRVGKGGGYSDLEWAMSRELGIVDDRTIVLSTVHPLQIVRRAIPMTTHDVPLDLIATPERIIRTRRRHAHPRGIDWSALSAAQIRAMPVLAALHARLRSSKTRA